MMKRNSFGRLATIIGGVAALLGTAMTPAIAQETLTIGTISA